MPGETLFVIDDDPFLRELLEGSLTESGFHVITAEAGEDAIHKLNANEFQVVLLDLSLPDMDGMELLPQIAETAPEAQIIIMTGYPTMESAIEALRNGAQDYIVKPFKLPEVHAAIGRALNNQRLQTELRDLRLKVRDLEQQLELRASGAPPGDARATVARPVGLPGAYGSSMAPTPPAPAPAPPPPVSGPSSPVPPSEDALDDAVSVEPSEAIETSQPVASQGEEEAPT